MDFDHPDEPLDRFERYRRMIERTETRKPETAPIVSRFDSPTPHEAGPEIPVASAFPPRRMNTTILGYIKYALTAIGWLAGFLSIDIGTGGSVTLPDPGSAWYVYVLVVLSFALILVVGIYQSKLMADAPATA